MRKVVFLFTRKDLVKTVWENNIIGDKHDKKQTFVQVCRNIFTFSFYFILIGYRNNNIDIVQYTIYNKNVYKFEN